MDTNEFTPVTPAPQQSKDMQAISLTLQEQEILAKLAEDGLTVRGVTGDWSVQINPWPTV